MATVKVLQKDGEVVISDSNGSATYPVTDGTVDVPDEDVARFLEKVHGATLGAAETATAAETKPANRQTLNASQGQGNTPA